jgi:hypothetical protein
VAATEVRRPLGLLTAAALALPGVLPQGAAAEEAPERATLEFKLLQYQDSQSVRTRYPYYDGTEPARLDRIRVHSPAARLVLPLGRAYAVEAGLVVDEVSGASPRYYSDVSGASRMSDRRTAVDTKLTHYRERSAYAIGLARSKENDYLSQALSLEGRWSSEDNNSTLGLSLGASSDTITPTGGGVRGVLRDTRKGNELMLSLTRAVSRNDLAQLSLGYSAGTGGFDDPYKQGDQRPRERQATTLTGRWNHFFEAVDGSLRSSWRHYNDSFGIRAQTLELQWVQPVGLQFKVSPSLRLYTQSAARFYVDPVTDLDIYPGPGPGATYATADQRLSAFGALTLGLKGELRWADWSFDLKFEKYEQRSNWRLGGKGSPGIDPFHATMVQLGMAYAF